MDSASGRLLVHHRPEPKPPILALQIFTKSFEIRSQRGQTAAAVNDGSVNGALAVSEPDEADDDEPEDPENYRTAFLLRTDLTANAAKQCE